MSTIDTLLHRVGTIYMTCCTGLLSTAEDFGKVIHGRNIGLMVIVGEGRIEMHHVHERLSQRIGFDDEPADTSSTPLVNAALDFPEEGLDLNERLEQVETQLLAEALRRADGNKTKAARLLGLNRTTLVEKIKRKGMV